MVDNAPNAGEVRAFAQQLLAWADRLAKAPRPCRVLADADRHEFVLALAEKARERARLCARTFPDAGFVSPGWRVLLEIYIREAGGYRVSLDDLTEWGRATAADGPRHHQRADRKAAGRAPRGRGRIARRLALALADRAAEDDRHAARVRRACGGRGEPVCSRSESRKSDLAVLI